PPARTSHASPATRPDASPLAGRRSTRSEGRMARLSSCGKRPATGAAAPGIQTNPHRGHGPRCPSQSHLTQASKGRTMTLIFTSTASGSSGEGIMPRLLIRRAGAFLLDILLLFLVLLPVGQLIRLAVGWPTASPTGQELWLAAVLNFSLPTWTYFVLSDRSPRGTTVGKRLLGLHVVHVTGGRIGTATALVRTAVKLLPWE